MAGAKNSLRPNKVTLIKTMLNEVSLAMDSTYKSNKDIVQKS